MLSSDLAYNLVLKKYEGKNEHRLAHILGVAKMAEFLAKRYNIDVNKAKTAAYMHDYCKYDDFTDAYKTLTKEEYEECLKYPFLFHAYLSAYKYRELIGDDIDIFNAIYNHVFGRENMSMLEAIIMISDYTEENRIYLPCVTCRHILVDDNNLELAIFKSLEYTINHIKEEGNIVHPRQLLVYEEYKRKVNL